MSKSAAFATGIALATFTTMPHVSGPAVASGLMSSTLIITGRIATLSQQPVRVGQSVTYTVEVTSSQDFVPRLVLQFSGLSSWARIGDPPGHLGWDEGDADYAPTAVRLPGGGTGIDFGTGQEGTLIFIPTKPGRHHFDVRVYSAHRKANKLYIDPTTARILSWRGAVLDSKENHK